MLLSCLNKMKGFCLWMLLALLLPLPLMAADGGRDVAQQGCHACHSEGQPALQQSEKCHSCHAENTGQSVDQPKDRHHKTVIKSASLDLPPGMTVPMYYPLSRVGALANEMIFIPAGDFTMGSDSRLEDEGPQHMARSGAYQIDVYEVTNLQYRQFIEATQRRSPPHFRNRSFPQGKVDHPVTFVSWFDAQAYCQWSDKRLPTEIEWEKAARGTDGRVYPWGNEFALQAANTPLRWVELGKTGLRKTGAVVEGDTSPVGAFAAGRSPYGLYDMSGNVWEWVDDWYGPHPGNDSQSENYGQINKVLKGGSWWDCSFYQCGISAPSFNRSFFSPRVRNSSFGFRCARDAQ